MNINIRREKLEDYDLINNLVLEAFKTAEHADGNEHDLVRRLRRSDCYISELSLVATISDEIIGHIMMTKLFIDEGDRKHQSLALAPVSVMPSFQKRGIGSKLINESLNLAKQMGYKSVFVLGSEKYYPKFGFIEALQYGIKAPFDVPSPNFMAIELEKDTLKDVSGTIVYANEFFQ